MQYKIHKLQFSTPVHFGSEKVGTSLENTINICHSDTFFSAVCQEILKLYDEIKLLDFVDTVEDGKFGFSSLLPYKRNSLFLPKPIIQVKPEREKFTTESSIRKKKMKKLEYISINDFERFLNCLKTGDSFDYNEDDYSFCETDTAAKVALRTDNENNDIYFVGETYFKADCGLYLIVKYEDETTLEFFEKVLDSLGYSGLGGKRSSGYGKFEVIDELYPDKGSNIEEEKLIYNLLENKGNYYETLSVVSPAEDEIEEYNFDNAYYKLISRNGFVYSTTYTDENALVKRKSLSMFKEGSCFPFDIKGEIQEVSDNGKHPVYKYGKMLKIGVTL